MNEQKLYSARLLLLGLSLVIHYANPAFAQMATADDRKYIADHLAVFFVPNVNATAVSKSGDKFFRLDIAGKKNTKNSFLGTGSNAGTAKTDSVLMAIFNDPGKGGDAKLQFILSKIFRIRGVPIMLLLFDDKDPLTKNAIDTFDICEDSKHVWFCANSVNYSSDGKFAGFKGFIQMGSHYINEFGVYETNATMCHELMHTQDLTNWYLHTFVITQPTKKSKKPKEEHQPYGADGVHYLEEAVPEMLAAYSEGIADASAFIYTQNTYSDFTYLHSLMWFSDGCLIQVEKNNYNKAANPNASDDNWLYDQIKKSGLAPYMQNKRYATYFLRDIPDLRIAMHNETIFAMIIAVYNEFMGYSNFYEIVNTVGQKKGNMALFFNELCNAVIPESSHAKPQSSPEQNILPLALADYFTHYKASDKVKFKSMFDDKELNSIQLDDGHLNTYWSVRDDLKKLLMANSLRATCVDLQTAKELYTADFNAIAARLNIKTK